jgi:HEAT repeat protein
LGTWNDVDITSAIPALASHATNATSWGLEPFMWGLVYSGPKGLSIVTNLLAHATSPQVREEAARSLWITPKVRTPETANALLSATKDVDANVRVTAILSLQSLLRQKGLDTIIVPGAILGLQDTNSEVRRWTIELLANYRSAPGVSAALSNLLSDPVPDVRSRAEAVLQPTGSEGRQH